MTTAVTVYPEICKYLCLLIVPPYVLFVYVSFCLKIVIVLPTFQVPKKGQQLYTTYVRHVLEERRISPRYTDSNSNTKY